MPVAETACYLYYIYSGLYSYVFDNIANVIVALLDNS